MTTIHVYLQGDHSFSTEVDEDITIEEAYEIVQTMIAEKELHAELEFVQIV